MNWSLNWFKSENVKNLEKLKLKEQKLKIKLLKQELKNNLEVPRIHPVDEIVEKPYKNVKLINDVLHVTLLNGELLTKSQATEDDFISVQNSISEEEIKVIMYGKEFLEEKEVKYKEIKKYNAFKDGVNKLTKFKDFEVKEDSVYFKGIDRSLPQLMVERLLEIVSIEDTTDTTLNNNTEYTSIKRFFMWCCLNPRAEVANDLYTFLMNNSFRITKQGFFAALRNVVTVETPGSNELVHFISNSFNKIKAVWKKNPKNYVVIKEDGIYKFEKANPHGVHRGEIIGHLDELYLDLPNREENRFTDAHTGTFDIRVGQIVSMPMEECNWNTADCGHSGLHFTSDEIHYVGCGDTSVLVLINPMKVVGIGTSKGRCYEYLPIMTVPTDEASKLLHDLEFDTLELDEQYAIDELANLKEKVKEGFIAEASKHTFNMPQFSNIQVDSIVLSLNEMKEEIKSRVKIII